MSSYEVQIIKVVECNVPINQVQGSSDKVRINVSSDEVQIIFELHDNIIWTLWLDIIIMSSNKIQIMSRSKVQICQVIKFNISSDKVQLCQAITNV